MDTPLSSSDVIGRLAESVDAALRMVVGDVKEQMSATNDAAQLRRLGAIRQFAGDHRPDLVSTFQREFAKQATLTADATAKPSGQNMTIAADEDNRFKLLSQELAKDIQARTNDELRLIANRLFELGGKRQPILAGVSLEASLLCSVLTVTLKKYQVDHETQRVFYRMLAPYLPNLVEEALLDMLKRLTTLPEPGLRAVAKAPTSGGEELIDALMHQVRAEIVRRSMPDAIAQFLSEHRFALGVIVLNMREDERMAFISLLLSTLDAHNWEQKRDKTKQILPAVLKRLQEHAQAAALPAERWEAFQVALSKWHTLLIRITSKNKETT